MRMHFLFYGIVQGVGFRYRAYMHANKMGIAGWCRNLSDGSVELEAEAEKTVIDAFLSKMRCEKYISIEKIDGCEIAEKHETSFVIK